MRSRATLLLFVIIAAGCVSARPDLPRDIFGVHPGMAAAEAYERLGAIGTLQRKERKRQEVWSVRDDRFEAAIIGLDEEQRIRFITAVAKPTARIRYSEIADPGNAEHESAGQTHTYRWIASRDQSTYYVIAIGGPELVQYYSLKQSPEAD